MNQSTLQQAMQEAIAHHNAGRLMQAENLYRQILSAQPVLAGVWGGLGVVLQQTGRFDEAIDAYRRAIAGRGDVAGWHNNLGIALVDAGMVEQAIASFDRAIAQQPGNPSFGSARLSALQYRSSLSPGQIAEEHFKWARQYADDLLPANPIATHRNQRIRIGYVSGELRDHPVGRFLLPVVELHNRERFEVFCYSDVKQPDEISARFQQSANACREIAGQPHDGVAQRIRSDAIDILVDLSGHLSGNRLMVFARKPAAVQVSWLGYPGTTGMKAMDYRLTDALADPPGLTDQLHSEKVIRLANTNWCFSPPADSPPVVDRTGSTIAFGSFNNFTKVTDGMLQAWGRILKAVAGSSLVLKAGAMVSAMVQRGLRDHFTRQQIDPNRLILLKPNDRYIDHLASYAQIDIALDTFPYHGTTTTCEALWMGVPVVTLAGESHVSRVGVSLLNSAGLNDLVASSVDQYVACTVALASDLSRLRKLQSQLRDRMMRSPLMNAPAFVRNVESAYSSMWNRVG